VAELGLPASACVFVDDLDANVRVAEPAGMTGVHHRRAEDTLPRLRSYSASTPRS